MAAAAGILAGAVSAEGQFASGVDLVEVYASVTTTDGQPVQGLTASDFTVLENGVPQRVQAFAEGDFPLSVAVALDRSSSMAGAPLAAARAGARSFLERLRPDDQAAVLAIGSQVETVAPLSTDRQAAARAIDALDAFGTTGLYDAIVAAIDLTGAGRGRRALVLLSDGTDRYSQASAADALARARSSNVLIYAVALGRKAVPVFAELAVASGGRSFHLTRPADLEGILRQVADELRHQYLLGYSPRPDAGAGWRSIEVRVHRPNVRVRARDGFLPGGA